jgi:hypothetical protein
MKINKYLKFVFISTPKVCTHTIYKILKDYYSEGLLDAGFHVNKIPGPYKDYFRWTVIRNPYSRAVSLWWTACRLAHLDQYQFRSKCGYKDNFTQFITWLADTSLEEREKEPLMMNQSEWLYPVEPICPVHVEDLEQELKRFPFWLDDIEIPQLNTTKEKIQDREKEEGHSIIRPPWQDFYKDEIARDAVLKWAGNDFKRFGYSMEITNE